MKPSLVIYGDCQAAAIYSGLARSAKIRAMVDVYLLNRVQPWDKVLEESPIHSEIWRRCNALWIQTGAHEPPSHYIGEVPSECKKITFSALYANALWPFYQYDKIMHPPAPEHAAYPYMDRFLTQVSEENSTEDRAYSRYEELLVGAINVVDRTLEGNLKLLAERDSGVDVPIAGYIFAHLATTRLFWTNTHPTSHLLRVLLERLLRATFPSEAKSGNILKEIVIEAFHDHDPLAAEQQHIVSEAVAKRLDLKWWDRDYSYACAKLGRSLTLEQYVIEFVRVRRSEVSRIAAIQKV